MLCWKCHSSSSSLCRPQSSPSPQRCKGYQTPNSPYSRWCRIRRSRSFAAKWLRSTIAAASFRLRLHHPRGTVLSVCFIRPTFCQLAHHRPPTSPSEATATVICPISATRGSVDTSRRTPKHQLSPPASPVRRISESSRRC